jgi:hypothetical protein
MSSFPAPAAVVESDTDAWIELVPGGENEFAITDAELAAAEGQYIVLDTQADQDRATWAALIQAQSLPLIENEADDRAYLEITSVREQPVAKPLPND